MQAAGIGHDRNEIGEAGDVAVALEGRLQDGTLADIAPPCAPAARRDGEATAPRLVKQRAKDGRAGKMR